MSEEKTLGSYLKEARELREYTPEHVEKVTGISTVYLSKLENDELAKPSASVLYKLSEMYQISLKELLISAGLIIKKQNPLTNGK